MRTPRSHHKGASLGHIGRSGVGAVVLAGLIGPVLGSAAWAGPSVPTALSTHTTVTRPTRAVEPDARLPCYMGGLCLTGETGGFVNKITAWTAFYDVGPTPYYISISDKGTGQQVAQCATGKECSATITFDSYNECRVFVAFIGGRTGYPPAPVQRTSADLVVCAPRLA